MECFYTRIEIGGELNRDSLVRLLNAIGESGAWFDLAANEDETAHIEETSQDMRPLELSNDDQPWGRFEDLEAFCRGNNLTYRRETSPKHEYEGVIAFWRPGMEQAVETPMDQDRGPYIALAELKARSEAGAYLADVVKSIEDATGPVPPIK